MPKEACLEEFEALAAIFLDEIVIGEEEPNGDTKVSMVLFPATGDDQESKYVTLTLELTLPSEYPKVSPIIRFRNPRGLSETLLDSLYRTMKECCSERLESQMIFELIDMGKEFLTINNRPASECPICLLSFTSCDIFYRSQCFHHFHSYCLGRYLQNVMQVAASGDHLPGDEPGKTCPVCREILEDDIDVKKLLESPPPFEESLEVVDGDAILKDWHLQQEKLKRLFEKQKSQGGIIDLTEIDKKRLVISSPRNGAAGDSSESPPSSSSDASTGVDDEELVLMQRNDGSNIGTVGGVVAPGRCPPHFIRSKLDSRNKHSLVNTNTVLSRHDSKSSTPAVKQQSVVGAKAGHHEDSLPSTKQPPPPPSTNVEEKGSVAKEGGGEVDGGNQPLGRERGRDGLHHYHHHHHGRGKGGHYGHGRRRYK